MYQYKIKREIEEKKTVLILPGEPLLDEDGSQILDEQGEVVLNDSNQNMESEIPKSAQEILDEENAAKQEAADELQPKIDAYEAAKQNQLQNGGPGPVGDFEVMKICNEHNGQFEVVFKEEE